MWMQVAWLTREVEVLSLRVSFAHFLLEEEGRAGRGRGEMAVFWA